MRRLAVRFFLICFALLCLTPIAATQTFTGSSLSTRSSGSGSGSGNWTLSENGYVGTYFTLAQPSPAPSRSPRALPARPTTPSPPA
jgi:hypothetical protein